jgi:hypothetical protein
MPLLCPLLCCGSPVDAVVVVPLWLVPDVFALLLLLEVWVLACEVVWLLEFDAAEAVELAEDEDEDEDAEEPEDEAPEDPDDDEDAAALCALLLALCAALLCELMLCCKVCEKGSALGVSADELVGELSNASKTALINESGDMAGPVYPVNPLDVRKTPAKRNIKRVSSEYSSER